MALRVLRRADAESARAAWTIATRRQLERWEPFVATDVLSGVGFGGPELESADTWTASREHHFALIAARNLIKALELEPALNVTVDPTLLLELKEGRDLHEHWDENMPIFNVWPRVEKPPFPSGKSFAERNPRKARTTGSAGRTPPGRSSCRTCRRWRCMTYLTQSRLRCSPQMPTSRNSCRRVCPRRGFTKTASGGRSAEWLSADGRAYLVDGDVPQLAADRAHPRPPGRLVGPLVLEQRDLVAAGELPGRRRLRNAWRPLSSRRTGSFPRAHQIAGGPIPQQSPSGLGR